MRKFAVPRAFSAAELDAAATVRGRLLPFMKSFQTTLTPDPGKVIKTLPHSQNGWRRLFERALPLPLSSGALVTVHSSVCFKKNTLCEPRPCNPATEAALQPVIWCSAISSSSSQGSSSPEECFFQTPVSPSPKGGPEKGDPTRKLTRGRLQK